MRQLLSHAYLEKYLLSFPGTFLDYPFGEDVAVYKVELAPGDQASAKMFALIAQGKEPVNLSLKCDPILAETLREKYESIVPGYHLNKKHWNTVVASGQLNEEEIKDLINHSYQLVSGKSLADL